MLFLPVIESDWTQNYYVTVTMSHMTYFGRNKTMHVQVGIVMCKMESNDHVGLELSLIDNTGGCFRMIYVAYHIRKSSRD